MELATKIEQVASAGEIYDNLAELRAAALAKNDPRCAYLIAKHTPGVDIEALQKIVIESKDPSYAYWFARFVNGADIRALHGVILESGSLNHNYHFVKFLKGESANAMANKDYDYEAERKNFDHAMEIVT